MKKNKFAELGLKRSDPLDLERLKEQLDNVVSGNGRFKRIAEMPPL